MKIDKIEDKLKEEIIERRAKGESYPAIAAWLNSLGLDENITFGDVYAWCTRQESRIIEIMKKKGTFGEKMAEQYFGTISQLNNMNAEMLELFYKLKEDPEMKEKSVSCPHCQKAFKIKMEDFSNMIKINEQIVKQIQHVDNVLGKIQKKSLNVTYNVIDINKKITQAMPDIVERMEKEGTLNNLMRQMKKKKRVITYEEIPES